MPARKVLVIDDSTMIRRMVSGILSKHFEVLEASDGVMGLQMAKQHHPDLILLDFVMPKMDGYDTLRHMRQEESLRRTPVIIMSGLKEQVTARIPEPFKGFDFIEKPFEAELLLDRIHHLLQLSPQAEAVETTEDATQKLLLAKMTSLETLLIQGMENLVQREVVTRLSVLGKRIQQQEIKTASLEAKVEHLTKQLDQQNRILAVIANEFKQMRALLTHQIKS
ncbi:response regulator [Trichothermofontia sp.]